MNPTALDQQTALIVIDLQKGITRLPTVHPGGPVIVNAAQLAARFRLLHLPVVLVRVAFSADEKDRLRLRVAHGRPLAPLAPDYSDLEEALNRQPEDIIVTKRQWGAFFGTDLDLQLRRRRVAGILLAGIATSMGVESTARQAFEHGYNVTIATDAVTDLNANAHSRSLDWIFPMLGELGTTEEILALLPANRTR
jgi:nicotinamidase-related amidase